MACCPHDEDFIAVATRLAVTSLGVIQRCTHVISRLLLGCQTAQFVFVFVLLWYLLQSGSGGGLGAAAGAEGPPRESQRVLGAPRAGGHQPLLGHQQPQSVCGRLWWQGVTSACGIFQTGQGNHHMARDRRPLRVQPPPPCTESMWILSCLCPGSIRHLSCSDRHHGGL